MTGDPRPAPRVAHVAILAAVVGAVAVAARLAVLADMERANPLFRVTVLDEAVYLREALRIRDGGSADAPSLVSLLWPWLLATFGATTRHSASLVNVTLGTATAVLAAAGAARLARSLVAGAVAGSVCALSGALVFQDTTAQIEPLLGLLVLATVLAQAAAARAPSPGRLALAGALLGAAVLGRGTNAALVLGLAPALFAPSARVGRRARDAAARALVVALAAAAPIVTFHAAVGAVPTSPGINVWLGNNPWSWTTRSFGTAELRLDPDAEAVEVRAIPESAEGRPLSVGDVNVWWLRRTAEACAASPGEALSHVGVKAALVFSPDDMGGNHDAVAERDFSALLGLVPVSGAWILVFAAAGFVVARPSVRGIDAPGLAALGFCAALVVVFPLTRYRSPVLPACAVLVGAGAAALRPGGSSRTRQAAGAAVAAGLAAVSMLADTLRPPQRAESWANLGAAAVQSGVGDGEAWLRRAAAEAADFPPPLVFLGYVRLDAGDPRGALDWFTQAAEVAGDHARWNGLHRDAVVGAARALAALGRGEEALDTLRAASDRHAGDAGFLAQSALVALAAGRSDVARECLVRARAIDATHPRVLEAARALRQ